MMWGLGNEEEWGKELGELEKGKIGSFMKEVDELGDEWEDRGVRGMGGWELCKDMVDVYCGCMWGGW